MGGIGLVLNVAKDALLTQQYAIDVTSHNIANVSTDGYTRQTAVIEAKDAAPYGGFLFGRGVELNDIVRNTNDFLEGRIQSGQSDLSSVSEQETYMSVLETVFDESSSRSLSTQFDEFWAAWNDLTDNPSGIPERNMLIENGTLLAQTFNDLSSNLREMSIELDHSIETGVDSINEILTELADINLKIVAIESNGNANDLRDQRDQLVTELSQYIDINTYEYDDGNLVVSTGKGFILVSRGDTYPLNFEGGSVNWESSSLAEIDITDTITGGKMGGWLEMRDEIIPEYSANLDELAKSLIWEVNSLHSQGAGLEGFSSVTGSYKVTDNEAVLGTVDSGLAYYDKITDGSFKIWLYDENGDVVGSADVAVDADGMTMNDLRDAVDALSFEGQDALNAMIKDGRLYIGIDDAYDGYSFAFSDDTSNVLAAMGINTFFQSSRARDIAISDSVSGNKNNIAGAKIYNNVGPATGASDNTSTGIITAGGQYTGSGDGIYEIEIVNATDFQWRKDGGTWTSGVMGTSVSLGSEGVTVTFNGSFDIGDTFTIDVTESSETNGDLSSGDNTNALAIADLQYRNVNVTQWTYGGETGPASEELSNTTLDEYLHMLISSIGIKSQSIQREKEYKETIQEQLTAARDNISGVSLDEEMTNLIKFQQAYTAAAKLITTSDEMMETLLSTR